MIENLIFNNYLERSTYRYTVALPIMHVIESYIQEGNDRTY